MPKILLTEDDEAVRAFVKRALEMDGHQIITAEDGEEGYDLLTEHNGVFDLVLTDIKMPYLDGIELARMSAAAFPQLPILMMTGFADQRERADGLENIVIDIVPKPFSLAQIRNAVKTALNDNNRDQAQPQSKHASLAN